MIVAASPGASRHRDLIVTLAALRSPSRTLAPISGKNQPAR
jgi:hypothetical protein